MGKSVDEECAHGHRSLELKVFDLGLIEVERDGIVGNGVAALQTQVGTFGNEAHELACHWYLAFRSFAERHSDSVAYALAEQSTYAKGTLDASVLALSCLGHA